MAAGRVVDSRGGQTNDASFAMPSGQPTTNEDETHSDGSLREHPARAPHRVAVQRRPGREICALLEL